MNLKKTQLNPKQLKRLEKMAKLATNSPLAITEHLFDIEDRLDKEMPVIANILEKVRGEKGEKGDKGEDGKNGEKGDKGETGKDGIDGKNGENKVGPEGRPGRDGHDGRDGRDGIDGINGLDGKDAPALDLEEIKRKLSHIEQISYANSVALPPTTTFFLKNGYTIGRAKNINFTGSAVSNVTIVGDQANISLSGGAGGGQVNSVIAGTGISVDSTDPANPIVSATGGGGTGTFYNDTVSGTINGINRIFTVPNTIGSAINLVLANSSYQEGVDYTFSGNTITMSFAPDASLSGQPFWFAYTTSTSILTETVSGTINGSNRTFTVPTAIITPIQLVLANSIYQNGVDYTTSGTTITFTTAPDFSLVGQPFWMVHT